MVISGASRGIGLAIAVAAAKQGANVVLLAKTAEPPTRNCRAPSTPRSRTSKRPAARPSPWSGDVRNEDDVQRLIDTAVDRFGGVDICVNNASAIATGSTEDLSAKRYDLMQEINCRGTFLMTKAAVPHLRKSANPHVLTISPPVNMNPYWLGGVHPAYTLSKYGMSLLTLGFAAEYAAEGIAANCLWPQTFIATSAVANMQDGTTLLSSSRSPRDHGRRCRRDPRPPGPRDHRPLLHRCRRAH